MTDSNQSRVVVVRIETDTAGEFCGHGCGYYRAFHCGDAFEKMAKGNKIKRTAACRAAEIEVRKHVVLIAESIIEHYKGPEDYPTDVIIVIKDYLELASAIAAAKEE
jgi:hypothetical protein